MCSSTILYYKYQFNACILEIKKQKINSKMHIHKYLYICNIHIYINICEFHCIFIYNI